MESRPLGTERTEPRTEDRLDEDRTTDGLDRTATDTEGRDSGHTLSTEDLVAAEPDSTTESATAESTEDGEQTLFDDSDVTRFRESWQGIQTAFVDDPQRAVKEADELVAVVIQNLAATFADHKKELESAWSQGEPATEDLRIALRRYRSFFNQLLRA
ncbi:hypothetical protein [Amycolatopsis regifaucium]|uniref:Uncharacterized protein n=1 Tax=Amycolatopsis regifaucium TaxID=546365 RepID=A0A154MRE5_9PSEU|nr:hypothetical protein [Amycolatopsis regifaucium]KZB86864.1 hypothetical protein AVL48_24810 [Amycolatopsis regifaucium]OKA09295.1 hypothetical protein ATP06_0207365 [Amycolatopsis regifaucium]